MIDKRYISRANAIGATAAINRIDTTTGLEYLSLAAAHSSLGYIGGRAEAKTDNYSHTVDKPRSLKILSVRHSESNVESKPDGKGGHISSSHVLVQGYELAEQLTVAEIEAQLQTNHAVDAANASISPKGSRLVGLSLAGHELKVDLDDAIFQECPTKDALRARFESDSELRNKFAWRFSADPGAVTIPEYKGYYVCSVVRNIEWVKDPHPDVTIDGYTLRWKGFGRIYLGELLVTADSRSLSMVRANLGSPADGSGSGGSVDQGSATLP